MFRKNIADAEEDKSMRYLASTLDSYSGRIIMGTGKSGPRILNFAPLLRLNEIPVNDLVADLMSVCEENEGAPVEIEFAMTFSDSGPHKFGFLQVRPMAVSKDEVVVEDHEMTVEDVLVSSTQVLGNGQSDQIMDIVFIRKDQFDVLKTHQLCLDLEKINASLVRDGKPYLLIGFGRWGTSDPTCGIPVNWGQISGAKAIVEASLANVNFEQSQGSHFFHNVTGFGVYYFSVPFEHTENIDWDWMESFPAVSGTETIKHIRVQKPLRIKVDGRTGKGVIHKN
jgi:hypothetical protein